MKKINILIIIALFIILVAFIYRNSFFIEGTYPNKNLDNINNSNMLPKLENLNYFTKNSKYTDSNGDTLIIPKDFAISSRKGENTIKNGLVVIDKNLNEFVFIPVSKDSFNENNYKEDFKNMSKEIIKSGGFFISRFVISSEKENDYKHIYSKQNLFPVHGLNLSQMNILISNFRKENNINAILMQDACYKEILKFISKNNSKNIMNYSKENIEIANSNIINNIFTIYTNSYNETYSNNCGLSSINEATFRIIFYI